MYSRDSDGGNLSQNCDRIRTKTLIKKSLKVNVRIIRRKLWVKILYSDRDIHVQKIKVKKLLFN